MMILTIIAMAIIVTVKGIYNNNNNINHNANQFIAMAIMIRML